VRLGDIYATNQKGYQMRMAGIGGTAGTNPIGDRPGTTTMAPKRRMWDSPAGRAHVFALGAFAVIVMLHGAAEARS